MFSKINTAGTNQQGTKRCFAKLLPNDLIDFASNDYLGFLSQKLFFKDTHEYLIKINSLRTNGSQFYLGTTSCIETEKIYC
jgi:7-keto-8-aminopelargonate synthetase-like enzyme